MSVSRCTHLRINGARCTMPAVNNKELCFNHESRMLRMRVRPCPPSTWNTVPLVTFIYPEDHGAILENIHAIARAFAHGQIDYRQAGVLDRLMNTALRTVRQAQRLEKSVTSEEMVRHFRLDSDGNARATEPSAETSPAPAPDPSGTASEATAIISTITAQADEKADEDDRKAMQSPNPQVKSTITRADSTLTETTPLKDAFSNTYISTSGNLKSVRSSRTSGTNRAVQIARLVATYTNLA